MVIPKRGFGEGLRNKYLNPPSHYLFNKFTLLHDILIALSSESCNDKNNDNHVQNMNNIIYCLLEIP